MLCGVFRVCENAEWYKSVFLNASQSGAGMQMKSDSAAFWLARFSNQRRADL